MRIAFLISAFTDPQHLRRLINALDSEESVFFVHIDRKVDEQPFMRMCNANNVHFLENRVNVYWGTYSQVEFQMRLISEALQAYDDFDFLFMLSGQDYPLWGIKRIKRYLESLQGAELLSAIRIDCQEVEERHKKIYRQFRPQTDWKWISPKLNDWLSKCWRKAARAIGLSKPLSFDVDGQEWHLYKGSDYFCLSRRLAEYVLEQWESNPEIKRYFESSFAPSETCIQTIAFNSPEFRDKADLHTGPYTTLKDVTRLHHIDYVPVIRIWREGDFTELQESGKMFARKFATGISDTVLDMIDEVAYRKNDIATY